MSNGNDLKNKVKEIADEGREFLADKASELMDEGLSSIEGGLEDAADQFKEEVQDALNPPRRIPWLGIATGIAVVAGVIYLARHRAQRVMLQKTMTKGLQGGAVLALMVPGGLRKARESADHVVRESARFLERVGEKIPVRVVMK